MLAWTIIALPGLAVIERLWQVLVAPALIDTSLAGVGNLLLFAGLLVFTTVMLTLVPGWYQRLLANADRDGPTLTIVAGVAAGVVLLAVFAIYPVVDSGQLGFYSDRDEAINVGAKRLLAGEDPYECRVMSGEHQACLAAGNPLGPLPGGLILSIPFQFFGGAAAMILLALPMYWVTSRALTHSTSMATLQVLVLLLFAPVAMAEILTGGDLLPNSLLVAVTLTALLLQPQVRWQTILFATLLGLVLCWRSHFLLVLPVLGLFLVRQYGWPRATALLAVTMMLMVGLTLPLLVTHGSDFPPLIVQQKLALVAGQGGQQLAMAVSAAVAVVAGCLARDIRSLYLGCAVALTVPVLFAIGFESIAAGRLKLAFYGWYALSATPFAFFSLLPAAALDQRAATTAR